MANKFERHRQAWTPVEIGKLRFMAGKGMSVKAIALSLTRSEESVKKQAKVEKLKVTKAR
jgi:DNA-binding NarL/FixJ family response regulator